MRIQRRNAPINQCQSKIIKLINRKWQIQFLCKYFYFPFPSSLPLTCSQSFPFSLPFVKFTQCKNRKKYVFVFAFILYLNVFYGGFCSDLTEYKKTKRANAYHTESNREQRKKTQIKKMVQKKTNASCERKRSSSKPKQIATIMTRGENESSNVW